MTWFLAGGAALTVVSSVYGQKKAKQKTQRQVSEENLRRSEANLANTIRAGYRQGLLNVQEGQFKKAAAQQGFSLSAAKSEALSAANANAAAAGSVGASVDAVANDIESKVGQMRAIQEEEQDVAEFNFDVQSREIQYELDNARVGALTADVPSSGEIWTNAALAGGGQFLSTYGASKMKLGPSSAPKQG